MHKIILAASIALVALSGCISTPGPVAYRTDPGAGVRTTRVPTTLTGIDAHQSLLILGVQ